MGVKEGKPPGPGAAMLLLSVGEDSMLPSGPVGVSSIAVSSGRVALGSSGLDVGVSDGGIVMVGVACSNASANAAILGKRS
jgi:hypothetical protein